MLENNIKETLDIAQKGNNLGEKITVVAATKMQSAETINKAINCGIEYVAENKVQEFNLKHGSLLPVHEHFIGHLQTNKIKYLIGKVELIQSVDTVKTAMAISELSAKRNVKTDILLEVNIGKEESKSGFMPEEILENYRIISKFDNITVKGLMAMLPPRLNEEETAKLCLQMRKYYDIIKENDANIQFLSVGMSDDWKIAVKNGSNMVRLGSCIFGKRNY